MPKTNATGEGGTPVEGVDSTGQPVQPEQQDAVVEATPATADAEVGDAEVSAQEQADHLRSIGVFADPSNGE